MKWIFFFCNWNGRIGRKMFWLLTIAVYVVAFVLLLIGAVVVSVLDLDDHWMEIFLLAPFYLEFVVDAKRGHDRNISTWVVGAFYVALAVCDALVEFGWLTEWPDQPVMSAQNLASFVIALLLGVVSLALLIELGFRKGKVGPNRYGPDPLASASAPPVD